MSKNHLLSPFPSLRPAFPAMWSPNLYEQVMGEMAQILDSTPSSSELYRSEDGKSYVMKLVVPGFSKDEVSVDVSKNHISVEATRKDNSLPSGWVSVRSVLPTSLSYRERVPATLDPSTAEAELKDGVLTITVSTVLKEGSGNKVQVK